MQKVKTYQIPELDESPDVTSRLWTREELDFIERYCRKKNILVMEHLNKTFGNDRSLSSVDQKMREARFRQDGK